MDFLKEIYLKKDLARINYIIKKGLHKVAADIPCPIGGHHYIYI